VSHQNWLVKGWHCVGPFFVRQHVHVNNYTRIVHTSGVQVTYVCVMQALKPNGISHSVVPDKPMTYNQWMQYIHAQNQST
jgi:hypothetical protein